MANNVKFLSNGLETYLSPEAISVLNRMVNAGIDKDLAFEIITADESAFDLPIPLKDKWITKIES